MAVNTPLNRMSAMNIAVPSMAGVYPGIAGVSADERRAVSWVYAGAVVHNSLFKGGSEAMILTIRYILTEGRHNGINSRFKRLTGKSYGNDSN